MSRPQPTKPLDVVQIKPLAESLARRIARQHADVDDLVQTGLLAYISDLRRLRRCSKTRSGTLKTPERAWALARTILRRAMFGYYGSAPERASWRSESLNQQPRPYPHAQADRYRIVALDDQTAHYGSSHLVVGQQTELLEMNDYLGALERACGHQARVIVENLIAPMGDCAMQLLIEMQRKRRAQSRGYSHSHPRVRVSQRAVREAMALDKQTWATELQRVRGFTRQWLTKTG